MVQLVLVDLRQRAWDEIVDVFASVVSDSHLSSAPSLSWEKRNYALRSKLSVEEERDVFGHAALLLASRCSLPGKLLNDAERNNDQYSC